MNKKERLEAFFNNQEVDHVPVGLWRHFPPQQSHGQAYIDAQMKFYRERILWLRDSCTELR